MRATAPFDERGPVLKFSEPADSQGVQSHHQGGGRTDPSPLGNRWKPISKVDRHGRYDLYACELHSRNDGVEFVSEPADFLQGVIVHK